MIESDIDDLLIVTALITCLLAGGIILWIYLDHRKYGPSSPRRTTRRPTK